MDRIRRFFKSARLALSFIPSFAARYGWELTQKFHNLVSEGYKKNAVAYSCIRLLATAVPEAPLRIYNSKGKEIPNHPVRTLLERPNPYMTEFEFWELAVTMLTICGRSHWWKERANDGSIIGLWPLRPDRMEPRFGDPTTGNPLLLGWDYSLETTTYILQAEEVLTFNYCDPGDETGGIVGGLGPLQVLAREVDTDNEATGFVYHTLKNAAVPGVVISTKRPLQKEDAQTLKDSFMQRYGAMHRGEPAIIDADSTVTPLAHTMSQLEFPNLRDVSESRIAAVIGTPPILVGLKIGLDRSTFSNVQEARRFFAETTLSIMWRRLSDQINLDLGNPKLGVIAKGEIARFDTSHVTALEQARVDRQARWQTALTAGAIMVDEFRVECGLDPLPDGVGQVFLRSVTVTEVLLADAGKPPTPVPPPPPPAPVEPGEPDPTAEPPAPAPAPAKPPKSLAGAQAKGQPDPRAIERRHLRRVDEMTAEFAPLLAHEYAAQGKRVVGRLFRAEPKGIEAKGIGDNLIQPDDEQAVSVIVAKIHGAAIAAGADDAAATLGLEDYQPGPRLTQTILERLANNIVAINDTTRADVRRIVGQGIEAGTPYTEIAKALTGLYDETYSGRSKTIARTETTNAYNLSSLGTYQANGITQVLVYDGDYDPECAAADGQTWSLADADANPSEHPNCVRGFSPIVADPAARPALRLAS